MRTKAEFQQKVDDDLIWRRRELFNIRSAIEDTRQNKARQPALLRAGVALLYAHWEGFIKKAGTYYLQFVAGQGKNANELNFNFISIKLKVKLAEAAKSKNLTVSNELVDFFCTKLNSKLKIPFKGVVDTQSNLSSSVLRDILLALGLDSSSYSTKYHLIDTALVDRRNHIAHGDALDIGIDDYIELHDEVNALMDQFRNHVQNAVSTESYLRTLNA